MAEPIRHPAGPATAAGALAYLISERVPDWDRNVEGAVWIASEPGPDYDRWVMVDSTVHMFADPTHPGTPVAWRLGPLLAGYSGGVEIRIQLPEVTDNTDLDRCLAALTAIGALPDETRMTP